MGTARFTLYELSQDVKPYSQKNIIKEAITRFTALLQSRFLECWR